MATPLCYTIIIPFFTALLLVGWIHPRLVKIALLKNIVDNPDARKLQRTPVPVLGGVAVFFGVVIAIGCMSSVVDCSGLPVVIMAMMAMLYTGTMDDILSLSPGRDRRRFIADFRRRLLYRRFSWIVEYRPVFLLVCSAFDGRCGGRYYQCHQLGRWRQRSLVRLLHYGMSDLRHALLSCRRSADDYLGRSLGRRPDSLFSA